jgi:hypothetical protein
MLSNDKSKSWKDIAVQTTDGIILHDLKFGRHVSDNWSPLLSREGRYDRPYGSLVKFAVDGQGGTDHDDLEASDLD